MRAWRCPYFKTSTKSIGTSISCLNQAGMVMHMFWVAMKKSSMLDNMPSSSYEGIRIPSNLLPPYRAEWVGDFPPPSPRWCSYRSSGSVRFTGLSRPGHVLLTTTSSTHSSLSQRYNQSLQVCSFSFISLFRMAPFMFLTLKSTWGANVLYTWGRKNIFPPPGAKELKEL